MIDFIFSHLVPISILLGAIFIRGGLDNVANELLYKRLNDEANQQHK